MEIGVVLNLTDRTPSAIDCIPPLEERGFESVWLGEHTHLPVDSVFRYSSGKYSVGEKAQGGYVPEFYKRMYDPYTCLAVAAGLTSTIKLGTCIALPAEHNPIELAKRIASLDALSGGRFQFGVGYGWNPLEMSNNGFRYEDRRKVLREKVTAMKRLWTQETAQAEGEFVNFTESWSYPKPASDPHPPILLGAAPTKATIEDVVEFADGWMPVEAFVGDRLGEVIGTLRDGFTAAGRDPETLNVSVVNPAGAWKGKKSREDFRERMPSVDSIRRYEDIGVSRIILGAPVTDLDNYLWAIDEYATLLD